MWQNAQWPHTAVVTAVGAYGTHYEAKMHLRRNLPRRNLRRGTYVYGSNIPNHEDNREFQILPRCAGRHKV
jgi:hypothetical protein